MEKVILSYAEAIQEGIFLFMVDIDPSKGILMHTSQLTLVCLSISLLPF